MARFKYIDKNGQERSIEAPDAQTAIRTAVNIAPGSGVILATGNVSPVTRDGVDLSLVGAVGAIIPAPVIPPPIVSATPFVAPPPPAQDPTGLGGIATNIDAVKREIKVIEARLANQATERSDSLEHANVFSDMRALNRLNAELRIAQDRQIEVPIEQRRNLRGRGATFTEFEQATRPELESAALKELTASRASNRLAESINTNIQIVDTKLKADRDRDNFIHEQKQTYLNTLESAYSNIVTEQQKIKLEERKFQNELTLEKTKFENDLKGVALKAIIESGGSIPNNALNMSLGELGGAIRKTTATFAVDASVMDKDKDFIVLKGLKDLEQAALFYQKQVNQYGVVNKRNPNSAILDTAYQNVLQAYRRAVELGALQGADIGLVESAVRSAVDDSFALGLPKGLFTSNERLKKGVENSLQTTFEIIDRNRNNITEAISLKQPTWTQTPYFQLMTGVDPKTTSYTDPQALLNAIPASTTADFFNSLP